MEVLSSRFTPGATGDHVALQKGDKIKYRLFGLKYTIPARQLGKIKPM